MSLFYGDNSILYFKWTLGSGVVEWKLTLKGIYGPSMKAIW